MRPSYLSKMLFGIPLLLMNISGPVIAAEDLATELVEEQIAEDFRLFDGVVEQIRWSQE